MSASEESPVSRQRARMRCGEYKMLRVIEHRSLLLCTLAPEHVNNRPVKTVKGSYRCIRELFPSLAPMGLCHMCSYREYRVEQHHALISPFYEISVVRDVAAQIVVKFLIYVLQTRWYCHMRRYRKAQTVSLSRLMIRILSEYQHLDVCKRCSVICGEYILLGRIYRMCPVFFVDKPVQFCVIRLRKLRRQRRKPVIVYQFTVSLRICRSHSDNPSDRLSQVLCNGKAMPQVPHQPSLR